MTQAAPGVPLLQSKKEFDALLQLYQKMKPKYVVEIGSYKGGTLWYWLKHAQPGAHVLTIDVLPDVWEEGGIKYDKKTWQAWAPSGVTLYAITGRSEDPETIKKVTDVCPYVDFLFIDGRHTYPAVRADYDNYSPLVRKGGIIALHDIIDNLQNPVNRVSQLFAELKASGYKTQAFIANPNQTKFGIGVIFT
jgi:cephalosporin hydroxylase